MELQVAIVGTGNVATALAHAFAAKGISLAGICGRDAHKADLLAQKTNTSSISYEQLSSVDVVIIAVSDKSIADVSGLIPHGPVVAHTSGSMPLETITSKKAGVFYPLQTLSSTRLLAFSKIPICIEGETETLALLAKKISDRVVEMDSPHRKKLHLAAVMVNNFANHLYAKAAEYLKNEDLDFNLLLPLIDETSDKLQQLDPDSAQTGPAKREDMDVIQDQLQMLANDPDLTKLYRIFTDSIISHGKKL